MNSFDPVTIEIKGKNLIEASAGTGKTYAIALLYLRLLIEKELLPENILVVTFTEAATKELRERIRERIRDARDYFAPNSGIETKDETLKALLSRYMEIAPACEARTLQRLEASLHGFDSAAISTIHGFCSRILKESAFESASLYDIELTADMDVIFAEVAEDFWRANFFAENSKLLPLAISKKWSAEKFARFLRGKTGNPAVTVIPRFSDAEEEKNDTACNELYREICSEWEKERDNIEKILFCHEALSRSRENYRTDMIPDILKEMERYVEDGSPYQLFDNFRKFTTTFMLSACKKKPQPPSALFFDLCDRISTLMEERSLILLTRLITYAEAKLPAKKMKHNVRSYDDLIADLYSALENDAGGVLKRRILENFRGALVDEFQDTDQLQYGILRKIFGDGSIPLFLIGDPKQAIYSFRGADIHAYMAAREETLLERGFTMTQNWRSSPMMLHGISRLFGLKGARPFFLENLECPELSAAGHHLLFDAGNRDSAPFQIWFMGRDAGDEKPIDINAALPRIINSVVSEIASLLEEAGRGGVMIDGRPLEPCDIAVIVRSNREARLLHTALSNSGIPSVTRCNEGVFGSEEAIEMRYLLSAIIDPACAPKLRAALATSIFGKSAEEIAAYIDDDPDGWEKCLSSFHEYNEIWRKRGFICMFRIMASREGVRARLLSLPSGERRLTNFMHMAELLDNKEKESRTGAERLFIWLNEQISSGMENEDCQIRLESDDKSVRVMTVHVSKGLEFPVVFVPFLWREISPQDDSLFFHENGQCFMDFGSKDFGKHRETARLEALSESLRLLYVAMTRAKYRCYLIWGRFRGIESSPLAYLLNLHEKEVSNNVFDLMKEKLENVSDETLLLPLWSLARNSGGSISVTLNPSTEIEHFNDKNKVSGELSLRRLDRKLQDWWRVSSFTSLSADQGETGDSHHHGWKNADAGIARSAQSGLSIFSFPRGALAGSFLHSVMEKIDPEEATGEKLAEQLSRMLEQSFGKIWLTTVCDMITYVCAAPLGFASDKFSLSDIPAASRIPEMEFYFPLKKIRSHSLSDILEKHGEKCAELAEIGRKLGFRETGGMLHGFIDLVVEHNEKFYIIDWKSNHLGERPEDYSRENLKTEMVRNLYPFQYLLYTVALNRYLERTFPGYGYDGNFGGVIYVFLRGVNPDYPEHGIYFELPDKALVDELTRFLVQRQ